MVGVLLVHDGRQGIDRLAVHQDFQLLKLVGAVRLEIDNPARRSLWCATSRCQKIDDQFGQRNLEIELERGAERGIPGFYNCRAGF